jgi:hypothetical protein
MDHQPIEKKRITMPVRADSRTLENGSGNGEADESRRQRKPIGAIPVDLAPWLRLDAPGLGVIDQPLRDHGGGHHRLYRTGCGDGER